MSESSADLKKTSTENTATESLQRRRYTGIPLIPNSLPVPPSSSNILLLSPIVRPGTRSEPDKLCNLQLLVSNVSYQQTKQPATNLLVPVKTLPTLTTCSTPLLPTTSTVSLQKIHLGTNEQKEDAVDQNNGTRLLNKTDVGKLEGVLCPNCGVQTADRDKCLFCKKVIPSTAKRINSQFRKRVYAQSTSAATNEPSGIKASVEPSSFYGNVGLSEFMRYSKVGKTNTIKVRKVSQLVPQNKSECIMISDSSDDDLGSKLSSGALSISVPLPETNLNTVPTAALENEASSSSEVSFDSLNQVTESQQILSSDLWKYETLNVQVTSTRIGQLHVTPPSPLRVCGVNFCLSLPMHIVRLQWFSIEHIEISNNPQEPCLYFFIKDECLGVFRSQLGMIPGKIPYFDPVGPVDQKFFIIYIAKSWFAEYSRDLREKFCFIRSKHKLPLEFFCEVTDAESNARQMQIAQADPELNGSMAMQYSPSLIPPTEISTHSLTRVLRPSLSKDCHTNVSLSFCGQRKHLAIYPPPPAKGGITITNEDEFCLNDGEFLNDVIVDFYLKYTILELISDEDRERSHVFSCFFYERLSQPETTKLKSAPNTPSMPQRRHMRVKKWTRNVDLFSKDFIFIPINDAAHWYLAVICFPGAQPSSAKNESPSIASVEEISTHNGANELVISDVRSIRNNSCSSQDALCAETDGADFKDFPPVSITAKSTSSSSSTRQPCILIFDSLRSSCRSRSAKILREYLTEEWRTRKSEESGERIFDSSTMKMCSPVVPQQDNYSDCGVFLLHYVEMLFQKPIQDFALPVKSLQNWFDPVECKEKRLQIRQIIRKLSVAQADSDS
ncbi:uncharacterized protein LOC143466105 isoform X1 [Clavelina lepadiformis]|uniref:uncharacterized protein LOC143466105 isoform X1 n=1 Tax=Clavelina lepadiformis TaxID=159417 RepID=UPI004041179F